MNAKRVKPIAGCRRKDRQKVNIMNEMKQQNMQDMIELLLSHRSVRAFTEQAVTEDTVDTILACAQQAPTSSYLQAYTIIRVADTGKRAALAEYAGGQEWVRKAPLVLLFCADLHRLDVLVRPEDANVLHNTELYTVGVVDAALAAQKALIAAQALGLGGVVVGGVRNETEKMAALFELPQLVFPMFLLCLGYPQTVPEQRPRLARQFIYDVDRYPKLPDEKQLAEYEETVRQYFLRASNGKSDRGWTPRCRFAISQKPRYTLDAFLKKAGFMTKHEPEKK